MKDTTMRSVSTALLGLAGLACGATAFAQNVQITETNAAEARGHVAASMKAAAQGQKVGMLTGKLNPQPVVHADGTVSQELDAGSMMYTVARRNADGSIELVCVNGSEAAQKALKAPTFAKRSSAAAKEHFHVK